MMCKSILCCAYYVYGGNYCKMETVSFLPWSISGGSPPTNTLREYISGGGENEQLEDEEEEEEEAEDTLPLL